MAERSDGKPRATGAARGPREREPPTIASLPTSEKAGLGRPALAVRRTPTRPGKVLCRDRHPAGRRPHRVSRWCPLARGLKSPPTWELRVIFAGERRGRRGLDKGV